MLGRVWSVSGLCLVFKFSSMVTLPLGVFERLQYLIVALSWASLSINSYKAILAKLTLPSYHILAEMASLCFYKLKK